MPSILLINTLEMGLTFLFLLIIFYFEDLYSSKI